MDRYKSRRRRCELHRRHPLSLQHLEERRLLATITWDSPTGGSWLEASNWDLGRTPEAGDDVVIPDLAGDESVTFSSGVATVDSVTSGESLVLGSNSDLTVIGSLHVAGALELHGGILRSATVQTDLRLTNGGVLDGVTIAAGASVDGTQVPPSFPDFRTTVTVLNGLVLDGSLDLGSAEDSLHSWVFFEGSQTLSGSGTVTFHGMEDNALFASGGGTSTLTIGSGITITGEQGSLTSGTYGASESIINHGMIDVDALLIGGVDWVNLGTINADGAEVTLDGSFAATALGTFSAVGGNVELSGTLNNTGNALTFEANRGGDWQLRGGTIQGGTLASADGSRLLLTSTDGTLDGVTVAAGMVIDGATAAFNDLIIQNGLVLEGNLLVGDDAGTSSARIYLQETQSITGGGSITFGDFGDSATYANTLYAEGDNAVITVGPGMTINGRNVRLLSDGTYNGTEEFVLQGTIEADQQLTLASNHWVNTGSISADGAEVILGGTFETSSFENFSAAGATVRLEGTLDNTGETLTLSAARGGDWQLNEGTIQAGTIASADGSRLLLSGFNNTLDSVTITAGTVVTGTNSRVDVLNGLVLNGDLQLGADDGSDYAQVTFRDSQTLSGTGTVTFGGSHFNSVFARNSGTMVTIAAGITIAGRSGRVTSANVGNAEGFIFNGIIDVDERLTLGGENWVNNGTINVQGAEVTLDGLFTPAAMGNFDATGATVNLEGILDNTGNTFTLLSGLGGDWNLVGGTIIGGIISSTDGYKLTFTSSEATLDGVTISAGTVVDGSIPNNASGKKLTVRNGLVLDGSLLVGAVDGSNSAEVTFRGTQTLSGSGTVTFGSSEFNSLFARYRDYVDPRSGGRNHGECRRHSQLYRFWRDDRQSGCDHD